MYSMARDRSCRNGACGQNRAREVKEVVWGHRVSGLPLRIAVGVANNTKFMFPPLLTASMFRRKSDNKNWKREKCR